jgi:hypothetical protein
MIPSPSVPFHLSTSVKKEEVVVEKPKFIWSEVDMFSDVNLSITPKTVFNETLENIAQLPDTNPRKSFLFKMASYLNEMRTHYFGMPLIVAINGRRVGERVLDYHLFVHNKIKTGAMMHDTNSLNGVMIANDMESSKRIIEDLHLVRQVGNDAAHDLREITRKDVSMVMSVAFKLAKHAYEMEKRMPVFSVGIRQPIAPPIRVNRLQTRVGVKTVKPVPNNAVRIQEEADKRREQRRASIEVSRLTNVGNDRYLNAFDVFISDTLTSENDFFWGCNLKKAHAYVKGCNTLPTRESKHNYARGLGMWLEHNSMIYEFKTMSPARMEKWGVFKQSLRCVCKRGPLNTPLQMWLIEPVVVEKPVVIAVVEKPVVIEEPVVIAVVEEPVVTKRRNVFRECRNRSVM